MNADQLTAGSFKVTPLANIGDLLSKNKSGNMTAKQVVKRANMHINS